MWHETVQLFVSMDPMGRRGVEEILEKGDFICFSRREAARRTHTGGRGPRRGAEMTIIFQFIMSCMGMGLGLGA